MYSRLFLFQFDPAKRDGVEALARQAHEMMKTHAGFRSVNFFADWMGGEGGALSLWSTREDIEAYTSESGPLMRVAAAGLFLGKPKVIVAEILEED